MRAAADGRGYASARWPRWAAWLRLDAAGVQDEAAERCLNMASRAAEAIVEIEVAECGFEVVAPEQTDHAAAKPYAFGIAGRSGHLVFDFRVLVDLLHRFLAGRCFLVRRRRGLGVGVLRGSRGIHRANGRREEKERGAHGAGKTKHSMQHGLTWLGQERDK